VIFSFLKASDIHHYIPAYLITLTSFRRVKKATEAEYIRLSSNLYIISHVVPSHTTVFVEAGRQLSFVRQINLGRVCFPRRGRVHHLSIIGLDGTMRCPGEGVTVNSAGSRYSALLFRSYSAHAFVFLCCFVVIFSFPSLVPSISPFLKYWVSLLVYVFLLCVSNNRIFSFTSRIVVGQASCI